MNSPRRPNLSEARKIATDTFEADPKIVSLRILVTLGDVEMELEIDRSGRVTEAA
jgi:hypothetical protein